MKLSDLGLKQKPETKYFAGGYISFSTENKSLDYRIYKVSKTSQALIDCGGVLSKDQFDELISIKTISDVTKRIYQ